MVREVWEEACARILQCEYIGCQRVDDPQNPEGRTMYYQTRFWAAVELEEFELAPSRDPRTQAGQTERLPHEPYLGKRADREDNFGGGAQTSGKSPTDAAGPMRSPALTGQTGSHQRLMPAAGRSRNTKNTPMMSLPLPGPDARLHGRRRQPCRHSLASREEAVLTRGNPSNAAVRINRGGVWSLGAHFSPQ